MGNKKYSTRTYRSTGTDFLDDLFSIGTSIVKIAAIDEEIEREKHLQQEARIEAQKRILEEEERERAMSDVSDAVSQAYISQFKNATTDRERMIIASALVKAGTKLDPITLAKIQETFIGGYNRSGFMSNYYHKLVK